MGFPGWQWCHNCKCMGPKCKARKLCPPLLPLDSMFRDYGKHRAPCLGMGSRDWSAGCFRGMANQGAHSLGNACTAATRRGF
jgi:hypothetical protein